MKCSWQGESIQTPHRESSARPQPRLRSTETTALASSSGHGRTTARLKWRPSTARVGSRLGTRTTTASPDISFWGPLKTNHFSVVKAAERDLIGVSMTNSTKLVAAHRGADKMLGRRRRAPVTPQGQTLLHFPSLRFMAPPSSSTWPLRPSRSARSNLPSDGAKTFRCEISFSTPNIFGNYFDISIAPPSVPSTAG